MIYIFEREREREHRGVDINLQGLPHQDDTNMSGFVLIWII